MAEEGLWVFAGVAVLSIIYYSFFGKKPTAPAAKRHNSHASLRANTYRSRDVTDSPRDNTYRYDMSRDNTCGYNMSRDNNYAYETTRDNTYGYDMPRDNTYRQHNMPRSNAHRYATARTVLIAQRYATPDYRQKSRELQSLADKYRGCKSIGPSQASEEWWLDHLTVGMITAVEIATEYGERFICRCDPNCNCVIYQTTYDTAIYSPNEKCIISVTPTDAKGEPKDWWVHAQVPHKI